MQLPLREVAQFLDLCGADDRFSSSASASADAIVTGWSVDSRTIQPGDLFFALRGPNHNGHAYVGEVFRKGALAVVVDQDVDQQTAEAGRILRVEDTLQGLGQL